MYLQSSVSTSGVRGWSLSPRTKPFSYNSASARSATSVTLVKSKERKMVAPYNINVTIYTKDNCPNCVTAKRILDAANLKYADVDIMVGERMANLVKEFPDARQMPQIFINDQRVGGVEGLKVALRQLGILQ